MATLLLAANLIENAAFFGFDYGHLQIVLKKGNSQTEIEVQAPNPATIPFGGKWQYPGPRNHTNKKFTSNYNVPGEYTAVELDLGGRVAEDVWSIIFQVNNQFSIQGSEIDYDKKQNSNSYARTLLYVVGIDFDAYRDQVKPEKVSSFPGDSNNVLQNEKTAISLTLSGTDRVDFMHTGLGDDILIGNGGDDVLSGGGGNDVLRGGAGKDNLTGGDGYDVADYGLDPKGVTVDLVSGRATDGWGDQDTLEGFENVKLTNFDDRLTVYAPNPEISYTYDGGDGHNELVYVGGGLVFDDRKGLFYGEGVDKIVNFDSVTAYTNVITVLPNVRATRSLAGTYTTISSSSGGGIWVRGALYDYSHSPTRATFNLDSQDSFRISTSGSQISREGYIVADIKIGGVTHSGSIDHYFANTPRHVAHAHWSDLTGTNKGDTVNITGYNTYVVGVGFTAGTGNDRINIGLEAQDLTTLSPSGFNPNVAIAYTGGNDIIKGRLQELSLDASIRLEDVSVSANADQTNVWVSIAGKGSVHVKGYLGSIFVQSINAYAFFDSGSPEPYWGGVSQITEIPVFKFGTDADDELHGSLGNDVIDGGLGTNRLDGFVGNDTITSSGLFDTVHGGVGNDVLYTSGSRAEVNGGAGNDTFEAYGSENDLYGDAGNDTFILSNDNRAHGGTGNDIYQISRVAFGVYIDDTAGTNKLKLTETTQTGVKYNLTGFTIELFNAETSWLMATVQDYRSFSTITFSDGSAKSLSSFLSSTAQYVPIVTVPGVNVTYDATATLVTRGYQMGTGNDVLRGSEVRDMVNGGAGNDELYGNGGNDTLNGEDGNDFFIGGAGDDLINGGNGIDTISYFYSTGAIVANLSKGTVADGLGGTDKVSSIELVYGSAFNDAMTGSAGFDEFHGNAGDDTINSGDGNDWLFGDAGSDSLNGGSGFDIASYAFSTAGIVADLRAKTVADGMGGTDRVVNVECLFGSAFADSIVGSSLDEEFHGNAGNDALTGGAGNDILFGDAGNDTLDGGSGYDSASYAYSTAGITANLITRAVSDGMGGTDTLIGIECVWGSDYADTIVSGAGNDELHGNAGIDTISYAGAGAAVEVVLNLATAQATGGAGTDLIGEFENMTGSSFNDRLSGDGFANTIRGGSGNDILVGGAGNDLLYGEDGSDRLVGGAGADNLYGGGGQDTFVFDRYGIGTSDTVRDFKKADGDKIDISDSLTGFDRSQSVLSNFVKFTASGSNTTMMIDRDGTASAYSWQTAASFLGVTGLGVSDVVV